MTIVLVRHVLGDAEMPDLIVFEHLVDRIDRAATFIRMFHSCEGGGGPPGVRGV